MAISTGDDVTLAISASETDNKLPSTTQCNVSFVFSLSDKITPVLLPSDKIKLRYLKKK